MTLLNGPLHAAGSFRSRPPTLRGQALPSGQLAEHCRRQAVTEFALARRKWHPSTTTAAGYMHAHWKVLSRNDDWTFHSDRFGLQTRFDGVLKQLAVDLSPGHFQAPEAAGRREGRAMRSSANRLQAVAAALALVVLFGCPHPSQNPRQLAAEKIDQGVFLAEIGQHEAAIQAYGEAIALDPDYARAYYLRGNAWAHLREHEKAIDDYSQAIRLHPDYATAYVNRGLAWDNLNDYERAIEDHSKAIRLHPDDAKAYIYRGEAWDELDEQAKAKADFAKAEELGLHP